MAYLVGGLLFLGQGRLPPDGLVERRGASIADGLDRLARAARAAGRDPEGFCDAVVAEMLGSEGPADDVALLAVATGRARPGA